MSYLLNPYMSFGGVPPLTLVKRFNCGGSTVGDWEDDSALAVGGFTYSYGITVNVSGISNPPPNDVLSTIRYCGGGGDIYFPLNTANSGLVADTNYLVVLWFASNTGEATGLTFDVSINGVNKLNNYDIVVAAGAAGKAKKEEFEVTSNGLGELTIYVNDAPTQGKVSGIEIYLNS